MHIALYFENHRIRAVSLNFCINILGSPRGTRWAELIQNKAIPPQIPQPPKNTLFHTPKIPPFLPPLYKKSGSTEIEPLSKVSENAVFTRVFLTEISLEHTLKCFTMSGLIACHFVNCVVNCVESELLCELGKLGLSCCCAVFCVNAEFKIFLC